MSNLSYSSNLYLPKIGGKKGPKLSIISPISPKNETVNDYSDATMTGGLPTLVAGKHGNQTKTRNFLPITMMSLNIDKSKFAKEPSSSYDGKSPLINSRIIDAS